jgi:hypothetical protein
VCLTWLRRQLTLFELRFPAQSEFLVRPTGSAAVSPPPPPQRH